MREISGGAARQYISFDARSKRSFRDLKIVGCLQVHPVLSGGSKIPGKPHGGIGGDRALAIDYGADAVHGNSQIASKLIEADLYVPKVFTQDLTRVNGR